MARTTGIVLATGAMTIANASVFHDKPLDFRIPVASGLAAIGFALMERAAPQLAVAMAWTGFAVVLLTRTDPRTPSPAESALAWWQEGSK